MRASETRFELLVRLAWELRAVPATSLLVVPGNGEAVLWVMGTRGRREAVLAVLRVDRWLLLWRGTELDPAQMPEAALRIALGVAA